VQALKTFDDGFGAVAHRMFRADEKDAFLKNDGYILTVHVLAGGGGTRTVSKYLKSRVFHSGGVVVRYALFDSRGTVVETNILSRHASAEETEEQLEKWQTEV
jgi:hypothetical protein